MSSKPSRLSEKDRAILLFINRYTKENGYPPILQEIADEVSLTKSNVFEHIRNLVSLGLVFKRARASRALVITEAGRNVLSKEPGP